MVEFPKFHRAGIALGRAPQLAAHGMVVAPSGWASLVGIDVLRGGGTRVDAAIAIGAALMVAEPHQCGLGGDAFWLIRASGGTTVALNASGCAPGAARADELLAGGLSAVPPRSAYAVTVPGVVSGWAAAHDRYGRLPLDRLLAPAIATAQTGVPVTPVVAAQFATSLPLLASRAESSRVFLAGGNPPRVGDRLVQPDLARTLAQLATDPAAFYAGGLAEQIAEAIRAEGGWLTADDLARYRCDWTEPAAAPFGDWTVEEMGPNSQGVAALVGLELLSGCGLSPDSPQADWDHAGVEVAKVLMAVRDAEIGDPRSMRRPATDLLGDRYLDPLRRLLASSGPVSASAIAAVVGKRPAQKAPARGDTVHFAVVDSDGLAVSCIQSVFDDFGSGIVVPGTGILLHNRGSAFVLDSTSVNALTPGRRPLHTLAPGLATEGDATAAVFGAMGGHAQAQLHVQLVGAMAGQGLDPVLALDRPRWFVPPAPLGEAEVEVEERGELAGNLERRGHRVRLVEPFAQQMGHAQVILIDHCRGCLMGVADPRSDGLALGY